MPYLSCSVVNCKYYSKNRCTAGNIDVINKEANSISDTACKTFIYRKEDEAAGNHEVSDSIKIHCIVEKCMHHNKTNNTCEASVVEIIGDQATCDCETDCKTFVTKY